MSELKVNNLNYAYAQKQVLSHVNLNLKSGQTGVLVGKSGAGKSTLLRLIGGFLQTKDGLISINNIKVSGPVSRLIPGEPGVALVSQQFDLMPYITTKENVFQGMMHLLDDEKHAIADELLAVLGLSDVANHKTYTLSGGQQQRVAIAKALAQKPQLLLLDEVFAQLDKATKTEVMIGLKNYITKHSATALFVLHDAEDAFLLADEIFVLHQGHMVQVGKPVEVYQYPVSEEVAKLFGHINLIAENIADEIFSFSLNSAHVLDGKICLRPSQIKLGDIKSPYQIVSKIRMASHTLYIVQTKGVNIWIEDN